LSVWSTFAPASRSQSATSRCPISGAHPAPLDPELANEDPEELWVQPEEMPLLLPEEDIEAFSKLLRAHLTQLMSGSCALAAT